MSRRSSPAYAIGGVSWLGPFGAPAYAVIPPEGHWRCFICNDVFTSIDTAFRHFGIDPDVPPACARELEWLRAKFHNLSIGYGEDRNTRIEHDMKDLDERKRADRIIDQMLRKAR